MAAESATSLNGMWKMRYGEMQRPIPQHLKMQQAIPFSEAKKLGDMYRETIRLQRPFGWTWAGETSRRTVYTFKDPIAGLTAPADVKGCEFVCRDQIPWGAVDSAKSNEQSFANIMDEVKMSLDESAAFATELYMLYAGSHIGQIAADPGTGAVPEPITITAATFAPGIWAQAIGMPIDVYDSTLTTLRNSVSGDLTVYAFDGSRDGIQLTGTQASFDAIQINDVILPAGAKAEWSGANCAGIKKIMSNTGSLFGISAATYPSVWQAVPSTAGSNPGSLQVFTRAMAKAAAMGGMDTIRFYVSTFTWNDMNNDHAALRQTTEKEGKDLHLGSERITYHGPTGIIEIEPHPMIMAGEAFGLRLDHWKRGGVTEYSNAFRNESGAFDADVFFQYVPGKAGLEILGWFDQYPAFCSQPNRQVYITDIVNNDVGD